MNDLKRSSSSAVRRAMAAGQAKLVLLCATLAALFASVGLFHAASRVAVVGAGYNLVKVESRHRDLVREREHLRVERATLRAAPRLESVARSKLGMAPPTAAQLIAVKPLAARAAPPAPGKAVAQLDRPSASATP